MEKVKTELQRMLNVGVIEEVMITEPTSWVSPMVPVSKNCPDMRRFKRAEQVSEKRTVLTLQYQLPTADELLARL